jgi:uncharacterized protein YgiB involved in biofilm formation
MARSGPGEPKPTIERTGFGKKRAKATRSAAGNGAPIGKDEPPPKGGMKRSHKIALGATGVILAGAWLGSSGNQHISPSGSIDPGTDVRIYASVDECLAANKSFIPRTTAGGVPKFDEKSPEQLKCEVDFKEASENHIKNAPKFTAQPECEQQYGAGQCRSASFNGNPVFVPAMVGFMVGNYFANRRTPQALLPPRQAGAMPCPPGITPAMQPGCLMPRQQSSSSSSSGSWRSYSTSSGHTVSRDTSKPANTATRVPSGAAATPAARTTFGAAPTHALRSTTSTSSRSTTSRGGFGSTSRSIFRSSSS